MSEALPSVELRGVRFHAVTEERCVRHVLDELDAGRGGWVVTPNLDILRRCTREPAFAAMVDRADVVVADGMPLVWASRLQRTPLPQRIAGSDMIFSLCGGAAERGRSVFLLGGAPGTAEAAADVLREQYSSLRIAGWHCPPFGFEGDEGQMQQIRAALREARPDIVFVALGSPKQEHLIKSVRNEAPGAWWLGIGVTFSFVSGDLARSPRWMRRTGLEWVHRLIQEPRRLARRYLIEGIPFALNLLTRSAWRGVLCRAQPARVGVSERGN